MPPKPLLRHTPQRRLVLAIIKLSTVPMTAEDVVQSARRRLKGVSVSTIYRNLDILAQAGEIFKCVTPDGMTRFLGTTRPQAFFTCTNCGQQEVLDGQPIVEAVGKQLRGKTTGAVVPYVQGRCANCSKPRTRRAYV